MKKYFYILQLKIKKFQLKFPKFIIYVSSLDCALSRFLSLRFEQPSWSSIYWSPIDFSRRNDFNGYGDKRCLKDGFKTSYVPVTTGMLFIELKKFCDDFGYLYKKRNKIPGLGEFSCNCFS